MFLENIGKLSTKMMQKSVYHNTTNNFKMSQSFQETVGFYIEINILFAIS